MKLYRVLVFKDTDDARFGEPDIFEFEDIQEALGKYDYEMKMDHNDLKYYCIKVQKLNVIENFWWNLISFDCEVGDLNVLLKSS